MVEHLVTIKNRAGIHARPAALLVQQHNLSQRFLLKKEQNVLMANQLWVLSALGQHIIRN